MAKKTKKKAVAKPKEVVTKSGIDESALTAGQLRKLNALRKSVGEDLGEQTFSAWLKKQQSKEPAVATDKNAELIAETLMKLIDENKLRLPRGGYLVTRGRGRVVVTKAESG